MKVIIALDQGTGSSRAFAFTLDGRIVAKAQAPIACTFKHDGWVEQKPSDIWDSTHRVIQSVVEQVTRETMTIAAMGITNQRETTVLWDRVTGQPVYNAIVWQDRRTANWCKQFASANATVQQRTGLIVDPYFSASKIAWILEHCPEANALAAKGHLAFGTIDSFLIWHLTKGRCHVTDVTNASRTLLYNINELRWDQELLALFDLPETVLPVVYPNDALFGEVDSSLFGISIPITGVAGDQQAALIGQHCFEQGQAKMTFGTGAFLVANTGQQHVTSNNHLLSTLAYQIGNRHAYAIEGSLFNAGTITRWLRDQLNIIDDVKDTALLASEVENNGGIYFIPGLTGLGAPYWQPDAKGVFWGMQLDTDKRHLVRACLESIGYQTKDLLSAVSDDLGQPISTLQVDGGMAENRWLMQFIADLCGCELIKPFQTEVTVQGVAELAAFGAGLNSDLWAFKQSMDWQLMSTSTQPEAEYQQWRRLMKISCEAYRS